MPGLQSGRLFEYAIQPQAIDIIFAIDNSSSMHKEHKSLVQQLKPFLRKIQNIDYRIAVITTDISKSPENPTQTVLSKTEN